MGSPTFDQAHEATDRVFVASEIFERIVLDHPGIAKQPDLFAKATAISDALGDLYQAAGAATPDGGQ